MFRLMLSNAFLESTKDITRGRFLSKAPLSIRRIYDCVRHNHVLFENQPGWFAGLRQLDFEFVAEVVNCTVWQQLTLVIDR